MVKISDFGTNHLGSTTLVTNSEGDIIEDMTGETTPFGDQENKKLFYTGKQWDEDAELYYFNARWYDPETGRFITEDPIKDGLLWYSYCSNNPMTFVDPTGLSDDFFQDPDSNAKFLNQIFMNMLLGDAQKETMNNSVYQRGAAGPGNWDKANDNTTWCNQATYAIAKKTGFDLDNFRSEEAGNNLGLVDANEAARALRSNASEEGSSLVSIDAQAASDLVDQGYTVIAASENPNGIGHIATVSANQGDSDTGDPIIANIGWETDSMPASEAFHGRDVEYFYDMNQDISDQNPSYEIGSEVVR